MVKPKKTGNTDFEKVTTDDWTYGVIENVQYEPEHAFPIFKETSPGKYAKSGEKIGEGVRFVFKLEGYEYKHYSRWMKLNYGAKSTLFKKYITALIGPGAEPELDLDTDELIGKKVKIMWEGENFQSVALIKLWKGEPASSSQTEPDPEEAPLPSDDEVSGEDIPF